MLPFIMASGVTREGVLHGLACGEPANRIERVVDEPFGARRRTGPFK